MLFRSAGALQISNWFLMPMPVLPGKTPITTNPGNVGISTTQGSNTILVRGNQGRILRQAGFSVGHFFSINFSSFNDSRIYMAVSVAGSTSMTITFVPELPWNNTAGTCTFFNPMMRAYLNQDAAPQVSWGSGLIATPILRVTEAIGPLTR